MVTLDVEVILTWVTLVIAVCGAIAGMGRWVIKSLDHRIKEMTAPIQPGANGGASLPDVARSLKEFTEKMDKAHVRIHDRIDVIGEDVRDLQLWAAERPCLLEQHDRLSRARSRLKQAIEIEDEGKATGA